jgi:hypothetical protein
MHAEKPKSEGKRAERERRSGAALRRNLMRRNAQRRERDGRADDSEPRPPASDRHER